MISSVYSFWWLHDSYFLWRCSIFWGIVRLVFPCASVTTTPFGSSSCLFRVSRSIRRTGFYHHNRPGFSAHQGRTKDLAGRFGSDQRNGALNLEKFVIDGGRKLSGTVTPTRHTYRVRTQRYYLYAMIRVSEIQMRANMCVRAT